MPIKGGEMEKLFWKDPYMKECKAKVTMVSGNKVYLDQSIFFAFSGGQESDSGTINGIPVKEAKKVYYEIMYTLDAAPNFKEGDEVAVKIDWEKRYKIMRLHSVAEIVFTLLEQAFPNSKRIGANVSSDKARFDYELSENIAEKLPGLEKTANELIEKNLPILTSEDPAERERRWWEIKGFDRHPCGGTHVKTTGEIGKISLKRANVGSGKERVEIYLTKADS